VGCDGIPDGSSTFEGPVSSEGADDPAGPPDSWVPPDAFVTTTADAFSLGSSAHPPEFETDGCAAGSEDDAVSS